MIRTRNVYEKKCRNYFRWLTVAGGISFWENVIPQSGNRNRTDPRDVVSFAVKFPSPLILRPPFNSPAEYEISREPVRSWKIDCINYADIVWSSNEHSFRPKWRKYREPMHEFILTRAERAILIISLDFQRPILRRGLLKRYGLIQIASLIYSIAFPSFMKLVVPWKVFAFPVYRTRSNARICALADFKIEYKCTGSFVIGGGVVILHKKVCGKCGIKDAHGRLLFQDN